MSDRTATSSEVEQWSRDWEAGLLSGPLLQVRGSQCLAEGHLWHVADDQQGVAVRWCVRCGYRQQGTEPTLRPPRRQRKRQPAALWFLIACATILLLGQVWIVSALYGWRISLFLVLVWIGAMYYGIQIGLHLGWEHLPFRAK
jgi:Zn ribbon nucleic-acid-binding protein